LILNSSTNLNAKKDNYSDNNFDANNNNDSALDIKLLSTSRKRKAFTIVSIQQKSLSKTYIEAFNKFITIKKDKY